MFTSDMYAYRHMTGPLKDWHMIHLRYILDVQGTKLEQQTHEVSLIIIYTKKAPIRIH